MQCTASHKCSGGPPDIWPATDDAKNLVGMYRMEIGRSTSGALHAGCSQEKALAVPVPLPLTPRSVSSLAPYTVDPTTFRASEPLPKCIHGCGRVCLHASAIDVCVHVRKLNAAVWQCVPRYLDSHTHKFVATYGSHTTPQLSRPNILMFGDWSWIGRRTDEQHERFEEFLTGVSDCRERRRETRLRKERAHASFQTKVAHTRRRLGMTGANVAIPYTGPDPSQSPACRHMHRAC